MKLTNLRAKEANLRASRKKSFLIYRARNIRIISDQSTEKCQARKGWQDILRVLNEKNMQPKYIIQQHSLRMEGQLKSFQDRQKLKENVTTKPDLQEILRGIL